MYAASASGLLALSPSRTSCVGACIGASWHVMHALSLTALLNWPGRCGSGAWQAAQLFSIVAWAQVTWPGL